MRDLAPIVPGLGAAPLIGTMPAPLVDIPGLVAEIERRSAVLEAYCAQFEDVPDPDREFSRLGAEVVRAIKALAETPAHDHAGLVAKARALIECPAIDDAYERSDLVATSLARDVLRLFAAAALP